MSGQNAKRTRRTTEQTKKDKISKLESDIKLLTKKIEDKTAEIEQLNKDLTELANNPKRTRSPGAGRKTTFKTKELYVHAKDSDFYNEAIRKRYENDDPETFAAAIDAKYEELKAKEKAAKEAKKSN